MRHNNRARNIEGNYADFKNRQLIVCMVHTIAYAKHASSTKIGSSSKRSKLRKIIRRKKKQIISQKRRPRGLVYVGHIPHGFYEEQMSDYFKQFGKVTRVRVVRSKNTGRSRGYGYIEFLHPEVAKIAAETMNNYLMCGRLLKATYIPPEKQHQRYFAGTPWTKDSYPKLTNRNITMNVNNEQKKHASFVQSTKDKLSALEKKLIDKGYNLRITSIADIKV
ncbi:MKI67 FHA domain-interacting nucleolar phosphoprotein isoform X2 [Calliopsis andreniformis]|uniref:MKI67 FHA domain-interacting nucleolar phosphoprotein isoform X2 n=1 Tax=Calliopsis andreniformis TaxID=337506 RepID=UPI003FCD65DB